VSHRDLSEQGRALEQKLTHLQRQIDTLTARLGGIPAPRLAENAGAVNGTTDLNAPAAALLQIDLDPGRWVIIGKATCTIPQAEVTGSDGGQLYIVTGAVGVSPSVYHPAVVQGGFQANFTVLGVNPFVFSDVYIGSVSPTVPSTVYLRGLARSTLSSPNTAIWTLRSMIAIPL
jgi:hypothetical protein